MSKPPENFPPLPLSMKKKIVRTKRKLKKNQITVSSRELTTKQINMFRESKNVNTTKLRTKKQCKVKRIRAPKLTSQNNSFDIISPSGLLELVHKPSDN